VVPNCGKYGRCGFGGRCGCVLAWKVAGKDGGGMIPLRTMLRGRGPPSLELRRDKSAPGKFLMFPARARETTVDDRRHRGGRGPQWRFGERRVEGDDRHQSRVEGRGSKVWGRKSWVSAGFLPILSGAARACKLSAWWCTRSAWRCLFSVGPCEVEG